MKHYDISIMPTAKESLLDIGEYIALDNPARAISFIDELTGALRKNLSIFPLSGRIVEDLEIDEEIRIWPHGHYNSYYRVIESKQLVEILFIYHASRDIEALIKGM